MEIIYIALWLSIVLNVTLEIKILSSSDDHDHLEINNYERTKILNSDMIIST